MVDSDEECGALYSSDARTHGVDRRSPVCLQPGRRSIRFDDAWPTCSPGSFGGIDVDFIGRDAFIKNKRATGRAKDLGDLEALMAFGE